MYKTISFIATWWCQLHKKNICKIKVYQFILQHVKWHLRDNVPYRLICQIFMVVFITEFHIISWLGLDCTQLMVSYCKNLQKHVCFSCKNDWTMLGMGRCPKQLHIKSIYLHIYSLDSHVGPEKPAVQSHCALLPITWQTPLFWQGLGLQTSWTTGKDSFNIHQLTLRNSKYTLFFDSDENSFRIV